MSIQSLFKLSSRYGISKVIGSLGLMVSWWGCDDPELIELQPAGALMCADLRCDDEICALVDGAPRCFCPDGQFRDPRGVCVLGQSPMSPSSLRDAARVDAIPQDASPVEVVSDMMTDMMTDTMTDMITDIQPQPQRDASLELDLELDLDQAFTLDMRSLDMGAQDLEMSDLEMSDMTRADLGLSDSCTPNPCLEPGRGVCEVIEGGARCLCDPGLREDMMTGTCTLPALVRCVESHEGDLYEPDECHLDATAIFGNSSQTHTIEPGGDDDWFRLDSTPGHVYHFSVARDTLPNAILYLYREDGARQIFSQSSTYEITHEMPSAGPFYYRVSAYNNRGLGSYTAILHDLGPDDHGDDATSATRVTVGGVALPGDIETRGDDDWFVFTARAGQRYHVELTRGTLSDAYLYLYYPDGLRIAQSRSTPEEITYDVTEDGEWLIRARHNSSGRGTYLITVSEEP